MKATSSSAFPRKDILLAQEPFSIVPENAACLRRWLIEAG